MTLRGGRTMSVPTIISVNGRRTRIRIEGDPANPPMLLLHGVGRSLDDWAPQYPRLAGSHLVIALDIPGFGFSTRSPDTTTLEVLARGVIETLDALGERRPLHVIGNSLGGAIALQLLVLDPDRVASLALINSAGFDAKVALVLRLLATPVVGRVATRRTTRASALLIERMLYADPKLATKERIEHALAITANPTRASRCLRRLANWSPGAVSSRAGAPNSSPLPQTPPPHFDHLGRPRPYPATAPPRLSTQTASARTNTYVHRHRPPPQIECPDELATRVLDLSPTQARAMGDPPNPHRLASQPMLQDLQDTEATGELSARTPFPRTPSAKRTRLQCAQPI